MRSPRIAIGTLALLAAVASLPSAQREAPAPLAEVEIIYDAHSLPHVIGETDEAAFYGLGYQQMIDDPVGTLNLLWLHSGNMARIAGDSYLDEDKKIRIWNVPAIARRHQRQLRRERLLPLIKAYVQGINEARAWWRDGDSATSARIDALLGPNLDVRIDPVPDYLNQAFQPYGNFNDPWVPAYMRTAVNRLFDHPVTVSHVLRVGVCLNSFFLFRANPVPLNAIPPDTGPPPPDPIEPSPQELYGIPSAVQTAKASNGWLLAPGNVLNGGVLTHADGHLPFNKLHYRPYLVQVQGDRYSATGITVPGVPVIYSGFNDQFSWLITAPRGEPVARNHWEVTLESSADPLDLKFIFDTNDGATPDTVHVERVDETIYYYDFASGNLLPENYARHYVPVHASENAGMGFSKYPVTPTSSGEPLPGETMQFEQAAFSVAGSPWGSLIRFGRARNVSADLDAILDGSLMIFGNGHNLLSADSTGKFRYDFMAKIPRQGIGVPASEFSEKAILDGHQLDWRWQGFHLPSEMPSIGPADVSTGKEVWINNNVSPDLVETTRFSEENLTDFPAYMVPQSSASSWRQLRAEQLLRNLTGTVGTVYNENAGSDVRNMWMHMMWPFFVSATAGGPLALTADAANLMAWIEEYRSHDETDSSNPNYDFEAHQFSQVTVYATLLRSHYLDQLQLMGPIVFPPPGATDWSTFGIEPLHALFDDPTQFTYANYSPCFDAMIAAFEIVAAIWKEGSGAFGLVNQSLLEGLNVSIPGDPWGDPRYDTDIEPHWQSIIAGQKMTRWGHVNMAALTPHHLPPPKRQYVDGVPGNGGNKYQFIKGHTFTALAPQLLDSLPYNLLKIPFYEGQTVRVRPLRGVVDGLFHTSNQPIFYPPAPMDYQEAHYGWTSNDCWAYQPMTAGSQTAYAVHLRPGMGAQARFLETVTGTEITVPDLLGDGYLAHQKRFANAVDFSEGNWQPLLTDRALLGPATFRLDYKEFIEVTLPSVLPTAPFSSSTPSGQLR